MMWIHQLLVPQIPEWVAPSLPRGRGETVVSLLLRGNSPWRSNRYVRGFHEGLVLFQLHIVLYMYHHSERTRF